MHEIIVGFEDAPWFFGPSAPNLAKWLGDTRSYFKEDGVTVIQNDAILKTLAARIAAKKEKPGA